MRSNSKGFRAAMVGVGLIVVGVLLGRIIFSRGLKPGTAQPGTTEESTQSESVTAGVGGSGQRAGAPGSGPGASGPMLTNWEQKVDQVLRDGTTPDAKARSLLAVFPQIPRAGQADAAQHIANLISNDDYPKLGKYFIDPTTSPEVLDVLMKDLFNRPNAVKLPVLLEAAVNPKHPKATEARDILKVYLEKDYGDNPDLWRVKLAEWLQKNPA